jgi:hypothetical protein
LTDELVVEAARVVVVVALVVVVGNQPAGAADK